MGLKLQCIIGPRSSLYTLHFHSVARPRWPLLTQRSHFVVLGSTKMALKTTQKNKSGNISKPLKPSSAPLLLSSEAPPFKINKQVLKNNYDSTSLASSFGASWRKILKELSSLKLAIAELVVIAVMCSIGTIIEQGEMAEFYIQNYPEEHPILGFLTWRWILGLSFDHIYTAPYFLVLLGLLAASLAACTSTRQFPMVKVARRWSFLKSPAAILKMEESDTLQRAYLQDFGTLLMRAGYEVFAEGPALYAFKGLAGRLAPIGVHAAMLLIMGGATYTATGGYHGSVMIPQGLDLRISDGLVANGILSVPSPVMDLKLHVNKFYIDYRPSGEVGQFHTDLSVVDAQNQQLMRKTISVNDPLRFGGITMYQTNWRISTIQVRIDNSEPFNLAMAPLRQGNGKIYGTFIPLGSEGLDNAKGISLLARDLQSVAIYDQHGAFVGVRRPGSGRSITADGVNIVVDDIIGSTGLEMKMDPSVPIVYAGFGALMLTSCISYLSHSQVWALQDGKSLVVGGKSNRAKLAFKKELNDLLNSVPEIVNSNSEKIHDTK